MAKSLNKVMLIGNLGGHPETKSIPSGTLTNLTIATSESWKDRKTGQMQDRTEWHRVVLFNRLSDEGKCLRKGSKIYVEGQLRTRKWRDQSGQDRYTTEIVASDFHMLDANNGGQGQQGRQQQAPGQQDDQQQYYQQTSSFYDQD